ncbi:hypothetical protein EER27_14820 [Lysobacter psychrotolerans]|uniref:Uncharacterized protein n=1 Tax=Montanilutibacter psychrotolerans TaxID=1327343 RepID=A0A3M8SLP6_9GAMM|nr:hypothetical protein EER27_14820 [Lysobacter psychrotolerans]
MLIATTALATACSPVSARGLVDVAVVDRDSGQWLEPVHHRGKRWIAGTPGHRYGVRLTNTSGERVLVVLSVDGVNAVTGQTAHPSQAGYVLSPWQSTEISGWRKSLDDVAQFVFTDLPDSYAARTGRPDNVGVIGVAVFEESRPIRYDYPPPVAGMERDRAASKAAAPAADAAASGAMREQSAPQRIGTGHGQREWSPVSRTDFVRASRSPSQVSELRYDDHDNLIAIGVLPRYPRWPQPRRDGPEAFPNGFVADPPRW